MDAVPSLLQLCIQKLAQSLINYGPKKVRFRRLTELPRQALEPLLELLVTKNALNDNVLPHALTRQTQRLYLEGQSHLRRCVLNTIGRSCPELRMLDVRGCQQVDNRIVRDVLQYCEHLETLRLDSCTKISDSAFAPALWKPPLAGFLGLCELSVGKCAQITAEGLMGYIIKGAPLLRRLDLAYCRLAITDEVASELVFTLGLEALDLSFCTQITDAPFQAWPATVLRELRVSNTQITDSAVERIARRAPQLEVFDAGCVSRLTDHGIKALTEHCRQLKCLCVCYTQISDAAFQSIATCQHLEQLNASWCLHATSRSIEALVLGSQMPLRELVLDHVGAMNLDLGERFSLLPPPASPGWEAFTMKTSGASSSSPTLPPWVSGILPPDLSSFSLPPSVETHDLPAPPLLLLTSGELSPERQSLDSVSRPPCHSWEAHTLTSPLKQLASTYSSTLQQLRLDGMRDVVDAPALEAVASSCASLQQLALMLPPSRDADGALEASLHNVGLSCSQLVMLHIDASVRTHRPTVDSLALPAFPKLRSLTLTCSAKSGGLGDAELEHLLTGRTGLESLDLRNCEGLSEGLFPRWCNRGERHDEAELVQRLDQALISSLHFGGTTPASAQPPLQSDRLRNSRRRRHPRCPPAMALRSLTSFSLGGATALSDRSADALAELLHDSQTVVLRGSLLLTEESLRSFRKCCRFLKLVSIVLRDRTLYWTSTTKTVKKRHHRLKSTLWGTSGSSGTESN
mmetsp:Transcript_64466/g.127439  ORF Transcript_64466/g.127439 Transcript_64466/m.127439 type:complete len:745 (-) Transcript_64466:192-2426(-)